LVSRTATEMVISYSTFTVGFSFSFFAILFDLFFGFLEIKPSSPPVHVTN